MRQCVLEETRKEYDDGDDDDVDDDDADAISSLLKEIEANYQINYIPRVDLERPLFIHFNLYHFAFFSPFFVKKKRGGPYWPLLTHDLHSQSSQRC